MTQHRDDHQRPARLHVLRARGRISKRRWLGLAPVLFGLGQAVGHGLIFNRVARTATARGS